MILPHSGLSHMEGLLITITDALGLQTELGALSLRSSGEERARDSGPETGAQTLAQLWICA